MRRREGLVQVDVHGVDAEIAGPHLADDGVEVGAVAVEIGAGGVHGVGDLDHVALEQAAGVGVGQHDRRDVGAETLPHLVERRPCRRRAPARASTAKPSSAAVAGLVPCAEFGHQDRPVACSPRAVERGPDRHHAAQLAVRARLGRQRDRRHAGQLDQPARELGDQLERALHGRERLQRMDVAEAGQPRHLLVEARVVLHRARAERKDAGVDGVVVLRQAHIVAHRLGLGEAGKADRLVRSSPPSRRRERLPARRDRRRSVGAADLEDQRLLVLQPAVAGEGRRARRLVAPASSDGLGGSACQQPPSAPSRRRRDRRPCSPRSRRR